MYINKLYIILDVLTKCLMELNHLPIMFLQN